ncbi:MAG TPA: hypothetical protein DCM08_10705 [Microscillaceae bacterium]|jgi:O-antigen/teichoic acid export membrane protein|nr:hypothetical protein [Microscillaceae bacterium]
MGIIIRQGLKASAVSYVGVAIGAFSTIWLFPALLTPAQIGLLRLVQDTAFVLAGFAQLGAGNITDRFFPTFNDIRQKHHGFLVFLLLYAGLGLTVAAAFYFGFSQSLQAFYATKSPELLPYFPLIFALGGLIVYSFLLEAYARAHLRIVVPTLLREVVLKLALIGIVGGYAAGFLTFEQVLPALLVVYWLVLVALLLYLLRLGRLYWRLPDSDAFRLQIVKEMMRYAFFILLGGISALLILRIDTLMIGAILGTADTGIYSIAFFMGTVIEIPRRSFAQISTPIIAKAWKDNDMAQLADLYRRSCINLSLIGSFLFLGIYCNLDNIFALIPKTEIYRQGMGVVVWVALARWVDMSAGLNSEIILQSKYYQINIYLSAGLALLMVFANLLLIPWAGINGAALGTLLSISLWNLSKVGYLWYRFGLQPFTLANLWAIVLTAGLAGGVGLIAPMGSIWFDMAVRSVLIGILFPLLAWRLRLSPDITDWANYLGERVKRNFS